MLYFKNVLIYSNKVNIDEEIDKRLKTEKPTVSVVVVGHVDAGKSTLVAQESEITINDLYYRSYRIYYILYMI